MLCLLLYAVCACLLTKLSSLGCNDAERSSGGFGSVSLWQTMCREWVACLSYTLSVRGISLELSICTDNVLLQAASP